LLVSLPITRLCVQWSQRRCS